MGPRVAEHAATLDVVAEACVSRLRPVVLAAGTTIFGMAPPSQMDKGAECCLPGVM